jgi:hypothetical protein
MLLVHDCIRTRGSKFMQLFGKTCVTTLAMGLIFGLASTMSGCDSGSGGGEAADKKYIESNILKKLGNSGQAQSDEAKQKISARAKKK